MKHIFILLLFAQALSAFSQTQWSGDGLDLSFDTLSDRVVISRGFVGASTFIDCEPYETFSEWEATSEGNAGRTVHAHEWVYAERYDVNRSSGTTTLQYCPCGCGDQETEARICEACLRHETRVRSWGWTQKPKQESKYMQLKKKTKE